MNMDQYLDMFIEESRDHIQAINENLLVLENAPENIAIVQDIFRSAHTLKGMSASMGFEDMANLTHDMENVLDLVRNSKLSVTTEIMDTIFKSVDLLEQMLGSIIDGGDGRCDVSEIVSELKAIASGTAPAPKTKTKPKDKPIKADTLASSMTAVSSQPVSAQGSSDSGSTLQSDLEIYDFDEYTETIIRRALHSTDKKVYRLGVTLEEECVMKAARATLVTRAVENDGEGEIVRTVPSSEDIQEQNFETSFDLMVISSADEATIRKQVMDVSEVATVVVDSITIASLDGLRTSKQEAEIAEQEEIQKVAEESKGQSKGLSPKPASTSSKPSSAQSGKKPSAGKTIRVDIERLDVLMNLFSELVIDRGRLEQLSKEIGRGDLTETVEHMSRISGDLQNMILTMRMVPVETVFNRFPRMVRDLARDLEKKVNLVIEGAETELDRTVIDEIGDPLVHILRNSLDHGLEMPADRLANGKDETGTVLLRAFHSGNHVFIEIKDDGRGISREKVLAKAIEKGIVSLEQSASMTPQQIYGLLFASGFSTAEQVTDLSGRGVGLDVVRTKIENLGGSVTVDSTPGKGSVFLIQLPLTLSIISSMLVHVEQEKFAIPLNSIVETAVYRREDVKTVNGREVVDFRGRIIPLVSLKNTFNVPTYYDSGKEISVLIVRKGEKLAGFIVSNFIGQQEIVLKSLGKYLTNVFAVSGATILGDGQVALIIDCNALID